MVVKADRVTESDLHDLRSEQAVLGAILNAAWRWSVEREWVDPALGILEDQDFYRHAHQVIWASIKRVVADGNPPNTIFVADDIQRQGLTRVAMGPTYLLELDEAYWTERHYITNHARVVRTAALQRRLSYAAATGDADGIAAATQGLATLGVVDKPDDYPTMNEVASSYFDMMGEDSGSSVKTGIPKLDNSTGGFRPGNLVGIAARPGVGKSAMGLTIAYHASVKQGVPGGFLSLEMSTHEIMQRLVAMDANVSTTEARSPMSVVIDAVGRIADTPLYIRRPGSSVAEVLATAGPLVSQQGCRYIIIDYLQLMSAGTNNDNRPQEIAAITRQVKNWAQHMQVPVIMLAQLKRDQNHKGAPRLEDIGDSDALARDADIVLFLHPGDDEGAIATQPMSLIIAKHRNGPIGSVDMLFVRKTTRFAEAKTTE